MANYYGYARSNYFKVKDLDAFMRYCQAYRLKPFARGKDVPETHEDRVGFYAIDDAGFTNLKIDPETGEEQDGDYIEDLVLLLAEGEVVVLMEVGHEKLRYVSGVATAVNWKGEYEEIDLNDIYELATRLSPRPEQVTRCEY